MKRKLVALGLALGMSLTSLTAIAQEMVILPITTPVEGEGDFISIHQINMEAPITRAEFITVLVLTTVEELPPIMDTHYALPAMQKAESLGLIDLEKYPMETWSQLMPAEEKSEVLSKAMGNKEIDMGKVYTAFSRVLVKDVKVDGKAVEFGNLKPSHYNGKVMLPLRAVAEAMGFEITWEPTTYTATLSNGKIKSDVQMGFDVYSYTSEVAIGMSQPFSAGAAPKLVEGTMYVPAAYFGMFADMEVNNNAIHFTMK